MPMQGRDRWVWDLYPLSRHSWGNLQQPDDGTPPGQVATVRRERPRRRFGADGSVTTFGAIPVSRRFYVPTDDDLAILQQRFPRDDPEQPSWHQIKAALVVAGQPDATLVRSEAPVLLALFARSGDAVSSTAQPPTSEEAVHLSSGDCIDRLPLRGLSKRQKYHVLDKIRKRCRWLRNDSRGHIHRDDWRIIELMLKKHSISKAEVSGAVDVLPSDPSADEIAKLTAKLRSEHLEEKRSRK